MLSSAFIPMLLFIPYSFYFILFFSLNIGKEFVLISTAFTVFPEEG